MRKMGKSSDICAAVIDDLTFDPQYVQAAAVTARAIGVRCVRNHLQVALSPGDHRDDLTLAAMASEALTLGGTVPEGVEATAKDGDIALTGSVPTGTEREAAEVTSAELAGVRRLRNDIQIRDLEQHERLARNQSRDR